MNPRTTLSEALPGRLFLIGVSAVLMLLAVWALDYVVAKRSADAVLEPSALRLAAEPPIAAEANVFRTQSRDLAQSSDPARRRPAHPRTIATYRSLRAFPGAPPRIPHGLTADEFRGTGCNTCHQRGGFSVRFDAYAPVTPHPEFTECLQCHTPRDALVGVTLPRGDPDARCRQCHTPGVAQASFSALDWQPLAWPRLNQSALPGSPPVIPHDLQLRSNCLTCHLGVSAVAEIRTPHPERAICRQCHVAPDAAVFVRATSAPTRERP